jgi:hypothetical protein
MVENIGEGWRSAFWNTVRRDEIAVRLRDAVVLGPLGAWTQALTSAAVVTCREMGWQASAKWHELDLLPVRGSEYLALDVMAFAAGDKRWRFPVAAIELENSRTDDRIASSLWKVLSVRASLRLVFCYRPGAEQGAALVRFLAGEVVHAMTLPERIRMEGETVVVVGSRADAELFPYGFFKWWRLEPNTSQFELM